MTTQVQRHNNGFNFKLFDGFPCLCFHNLCWQICLRNLSSAFSEYFCGYKMWLVYGGVDGEVFSSTFTFSHAKQLNVFNRKKFCRMEKRLTTSYVRLRADWWSDDGKWSRTQPEGKLFVNKIVEYQITCHWCTTTRTEKEKHKPGEFSTFSCWKRSIHGGVKLSEVVRFDGKLVANFPRWKFQTRLNSSKHWQSTVAEMLFQTEKAFRNISYLCWIII